MSVEVICPECGSRMRLGEQFLGRKLKCPKCNRLFHANNGGQPVQAVQAVVAQVVEVAEVAQDVAQEAQVAEVAEVAQVDFAQLTQASPRKRRPKSRPASALVSEAAEDDEPVSPVGRKKRRKKKPERSYPVWALPLALLAGMILPAILVAVLIYFARDSEINFKKLFIAWAILWPINSVLVFVSMLISSHLVGGAEIGSIPKTLLKCAALILFIQPVFLLPFGFYTGMVLVPVWCICCMMLFDMDLWEGGFLFFVFFILNLVLKLTIVGAIVGTVTDKIEEMPDQDDSHLPATWDEGDIAQMGGKFFRHEGEGGFGIRFMSLKGLKIGDDDILRLREMRIRELDLSDTQVTDAGVKHLRRIKGLGVVNLTGTKVTDEGVKWMSLHLQEVGVKR